jgi:hypothetical protein
VSVWIVEANYDYEPGDIVAVCGSRQKADRWKARHDGACVRYHEEMERTDYESDMKAPEHLTADITVTEHKVR